MLELEDRKETCTGGICYPERRERKDALPLGLTHSYAMRVLDEMGWDKMQFL